MATVTRSSTTKPAAAAPTPSIKALIGNVKPLPTKLPLVPREPSHDINRHSILILGAAGTGKTTLGTQEKGVFNISFDPINDTYEIIQEQVNEWREVLNYLQMLETAAAQCLATRKPFPYRRVQIDGAGAMSRICTQWTCREQLGGIIHPNDAGYGKGSDLVNQNFTNAVDRFMALPCGIWWIAHEKIKTIEQPDGREIERVSPDIRGQMENILVGKCHMVVNIRYAPGGSKSRIARIRGDETYTAKCNINGRFLTPDGRMVEEIFLGKDGPEKAWERFMRAYNNKQPWATVDEMMKKEIKKAPEEKPTLPAPPEDEPPLEE